MFHGPQLTVPITIIYKNTVKYTKQSNCSIIKAATGMFGVGVFRRFSGMRNLRQKLERPQLVFPTVESVLADLGAQRRLSVDVENEIRFEFVLNAIADDDPVLLQVCRLKRTNESLATFETTHVA